MPKIGLEDLSMPQPSEKWAGRGLLEFGAPKWEIRTIFTRPTTAYAEKHRQSGPNRDGTLSAACRARVLIMSISHL